jgi:predicted RNA-binding Zn-ribbon protein involved in translation (DUF1610 family)
MAQSKKQAKFFCESCGAEVPQNAKFCAKCGRFFVSVKCPCCGHIGPSTAFTAGCPKCGYAEGRQPAAQRQRSSAAADASAAARKKESTLPVWVYLFTLGIMTVIILMFMHLR